MQVTEYPILDDQADPVIDSIFRVRLHSGDITPLLVAVASTKGCVGCFANNPDQSEGTCSQLPLCDDQLRADGEDCIFTLFTAATDATPTYRPVDFAPIGVAFKAPWDATKLIKAQTYSGCSGCIGAPHDCDFCEQLPLCSAFAREDGVAVRFVAVE